MEGWQKFFDPAFLPYLTACDYASSSSEAHKHSKLKSCGVCHPSQVFISQCIISDLKNLASYFCTTERTISTQCQWGLSIPAYLVGLAWIHSELLRRSHRMQQKVGKTSPLEKNDFPFHYEEMSEPNSKSVPEKKYTLLTSVKYLEHIKNLSYMP